MSDRRQAQRFACSRPTHAHLQMAHDVVVERSDATTLTVLSRASSTAGEQFTMRLRAVNGRSATVSVCTRASQPVLLDGGSVRYRLELQVLDGGADRLGPETT
jgi:hypothetical protein